MCEMGSEGPMSLYAIGDLHLHYQSVLRAPGQLHGRVWKNHEEKFRKYCGKMVFGDFLRWKPLKILE